MIILYILLLILVFSIIGYLALWIGAKATGVKVTFKSLLLPAFGVLTLSASFTIVRALLNVPVISPLLYILGITLGAIVWHKLLQRSHKTTVGKSIGSYALGLVLTWIASIILAASAMNYVQSYRMTGNNMSPVLNDGDRFLVYKKVSSFQKGDVLVYKYKMVTNTPEKPIEGRSVGRILGTPGETITPGRTYFNPDGLSIEFATYTLKDNEYYIVGDNSSVPFARIITSDSIIGKAGPILVKAN